MGNWNKPRPPTSPHAYAVMRIGNQYGVGIYQPGKPPERVRSVGLRLLDNRVQIAADRLNSRSGITKDEAAKIVAEAR